jgi:hypothetical protein
MRLDCRMTNRCIDAAIAGWFERWLPGSFDQCRSVSYELLDLFYSRLA